jgi:hypothetical protein
MLLLLLVLGTLAAPAWADITVINPSFEMTSGLNFSGPTFGKWNLGPIPGWDLTGEGGSWQPDTVAARSYSSVPDGITVAYSNGGSISQTLDASLIPNTTYNLSVDVGHRRDGLDPNYTIAIYAGSELLDSLTGSNGSIPIGTFADETLTFTSGEKVAPGMLKIVLSSNGGPQTAFDDVRLTAFALPEPASLSLLAVGCGLILFVFRRR